MLADAARERAVGHVILHDIHQRLVHLLILAGKFVEADAIPDLHKSSLVARVVDEKFGCGHFRTRNEHSMGRKFSIDMRFAGAFGGGKGYGLYTGGIGLLLCVGGVALASFFLIVDFDQIQKMINAGAPHEESWRAGFGLMVTVVWLYLEIIRLLSILRDR